MERGEQFSKTAGDGAEADDEGGLAEEQMGGIADEGGGPGAIGGLVVKGAGKLAGEREHHGQNVLGARFSIDGGGVGEEGAALVEGGAEVRAVVAFIAGGGEVDPLDGRGVEEGVGVDLAENDVGGGEEGIGLAIGEVGVLEINGGEDLMRLYAAAEELVGRWGELQVAPDAQAGIGHGREIPARGWGCNGREEVERRGIWEFEGVVMAGVGE